MRKCPQCNNQIGDEVAFCPHCGTKANVNPADRAGKRLHCPVCKSTRLAAMSEGVQSFGAATAIGKRSAIGTSAVMRQRSWMCNDCGHIFRNVDDLEAENKSKYTTCNIAIIIILGIAMLLGMLVGSLAGNGTGTLLVIIFGVIMAISLFLMKLWKNKKDADAEKLRHACFD